LHEATPPGFPIELLFPLALLFFLLGCGSLSFHVQELPQSLDLELRDAVLVRPVRRIRRVRGPRAGSLQGWGLFDSLSRHENISLWNFGGSRK